MSKTTNNSGEYFQPPISPVMTTTQSPELKPCPFCGNDGSGPIEQALHISHTHEDGKDFYCVQCDKCTATMGYSETEDEAAERWNTRTPTPTGELAEIMEWCEDISTKAAIAGALLSKSVPGSARGLLNAAKAWDESVSAKLNRILATKNGAK